MTQASLLLVDDESNVLTALRRVFIDEGMTILTETDPEKALELLREHEVSVIISDSRMPDMSGIEFLEKAKLQSPDAVRIMLTGYTDIQTAVEAINRGEVFRFITKPWSSEEVRAIVKEAAGRYQIIQSLRRADEGTLRSLAQTIELKDPYTRGHCDRVAEYALLLADGLGIDGKTKTMIKHGCWLHDCGKIGVPESVLNFEGPLKGKDLEVMKKHPQWGADVARKANLPETVVNIILYHHERFGGNGYPMGIAGEAIPMEARIVAIADIYDALSTDRPYRAGYSREKSLDIMNKMTTDGFMDPELLTLFSSLLPIARKEDGAGHGQ